ncbi:MAG: ABC transporter ATP-binding protein [Proteobacteria bacterium]|nr:ABC transporter ATP-binding protein [Pseudomonadota bacterium]MCH8187522.1 ABC transporter ATP-binding protein [Pseudomonadota bacterium]
MNTTQKAAAVVFEKVSKAFGSVVAVNEVSLTVEPGTLVTLLGPSGCGKTTTLRLIAGLEMPTAGKIFIAGRDVSLLPATDRDVSMVFQSYALFPHMTVLENVSYGLRVSGMKKKQAGEKAEAVLAQVNMPGYGARLPSELSGGQQQRVAVARALVLEPQVLLFDEPLSNLDAKLRRQVRQDIRELQQNLGLTTVYVTHDQAEALAVSDSIIVMRNAEIAQKGSPRDLYEKPEDIFVADFIGDANVVKAEIVRIDGEQAIVRVGVIEIPLPHRGLTPGEVDLAIRPESVQLSNGAAGDALAGEVLKATYLGGHIEYTVATPVGELFVIDPRVHMMFSPGGTVGVSFAERGVTLVHP